MYEYKTHVFVEYFLLQLLKIIITTNIITIQLLMI